ncbi:multidrug effflux MFS transporter [Neobacillus massiliamazoniensis]|uniref:Bcr/CflA family efflux transporter n=1 Tax=Neobacillus massiliamazoniensis TaxID=1499688 RepID=A0A0U1NXP5_9BACI|nr:multidrug effflux MFS transporter [Neobacillus massiliamazoniensis]CRK82706.1 Bcr/CflA subfamily drug resistance transporter [Neobacillus massiliamazoniensis]
MKENLAILQNNSRLSKSKRIWMACVLGSLSAFGPLSIDMYLPALPNLGKDFHANPSVVQLSLTFFLLGISSGQLFSGPLSDIRGRRKPLLIGLIIYFIVSLLCVFSTSIWTLIALRFIQGLSASAGVVISRAVVRDLYSGTELTKFFALLALVNGVAPIMAPVIGAQLLRFVPWQGVFIVLSLIGLIMFFVVLFGLPETLQLERRSTGGVKNTIVTFRNLILDRSFIGYALVQSLVFSAMFAYISGSPFVVQNIYGASPQMFSLIFAINGLGIMIASQVTGKLAGRIRESKLLVFGLGMSWMGAFILFIFLLLRLDLIFILLPLFFVVSSVGMVNTAGFSLAMQKQGKSAGSASALLGVLSLASGAIVAPLVGIGGGQSAIPMGVVIICVSSGAVLSYLCLVRKAKATTNDDGQ